MIRHDHAWECMILTHRQAVCGVVYGWVAFYDMHDECIRLARIQGMCGSLKTDLHVTGRIIWHMLPSPPFTRMATHRFFFTSRKATSNVNACECMRMTENDWECLISMEGCVSFHADLHSTTCMRMNWHCIRLSHNEWTGMNGWGMHQAISSWMSMYVMIMHENAWTCMRMYENDSYSRDA